MIIDSSFEIGNFSTLRDVRSILLNMVLFHSRGRGNPLDGAMPSFDLAFKSPLIGLSNDVSFVSKLFSEGALISKNILLKTCCTNIHVHQCILLKDFVV